MSDDEASAATGPPIVLVAGATRVGKSALIAKITGSDAGDAELLWSVETKYYTATLSVREARDAAASTSGRPEALVLVFSMESPETLREAQSIAGGFDLEAVEAQQQEQQEQQQQQAEQPGHLSKPTKAEADDEAAEERMLEGLERMMEEMRGHKARLAGMSDEERREQAAAMALRMMELLGLDEEGGSGSGSDDDE
ncbi:hypothetical protein GPECTOR_1g497 [Gonium pectorale]|uniref:Uncharacterized protein n=1 Tax=Gonium pectorale TaxID=33097 RepID=A0A150H3E8_GONPE|nr:hypothetical protein GPECTOR_1g497 [Gonium pectorale]|eukprot:KXZ56553.1 hypothetical protein GPECTOR_1g497 [Gonium pectorale]